LPLSEIAITSCGTGLRLSGAHRGIPDPDAPRCSNTALVEDLVSIGILTLAIGSRNGWIRSVDQREACAVRDAVDERTGILVSMLEVRAEHLPSQLLFVRQRR